MGLGLVRATASMMTRSPPTHKVQGAAASFARIAPVRALSTVQTGFESAGEIESKKGNGCGATTACSRRRSVQCVLTHRGNVQGVICPSCQSVAVCAIDCNHKSAAHMNASRLDPEGRIAIVLF